MNIQKIRKDFPILKTKINGNDLIYLDNAATSQKPKAVIDSLIDYYEKYNSNVHRGVHTLSVKATDEYEKSRTKVREFINADRDEEIIYTRNASESLNLIAYSWGSKNIKSGDDIFITPFEHHSNIVPWQELCKEKKANLKYIPLNESGDVDLDKLKSMVGNKTKLISVTHMSNVLGTLLPVKEIIEISKNTPAITVIDACQSVPHMPVDVKDLDCDFLCFSGHKMLGPTGIGVLYGKFDILDKMTPFLFGGDMISEVSYEDAKWNELPYKFEAGTPNIADAIALGVACEYLQNIGMENVWNHEVEVGEYIFNKFKSLYNFEILGDKSKEKRGGVVSFSHNEIHPHDIGSGLDRFGIAIRTGHHCAMPLVRSYGIVAASRASVYIYNTKEEIDIFIDRLLEVEEYFK
ncbi:MAG: cysteine desulfurase [Dehalococcoidia bacterium]|nr:cysteine desulfurase [Dehalococcoidia bacterium]MBH60736.1 cysteine desulfurase [Dehalococcoidia bacterium]|tara:strand:- start:6789 stop:8009 length:1221 start_codon:yes stop_codon:yes gene_type:complete